MKSVAIYAYNVFFRHFSLTNLELVVAQSSVDRLITAAQKIIHLKSYCCKCCIATVMATSTITFNSVSNI